jgi:hypothetical protein
VCVSGPAPNCDDDDPCTKDLCDGEGQCSHPPEDNDVPCGQEGTCLNGVCEEGGCDGTTVESFEYTGDVQSLDLPNLGCLTQVTVEVWGAQGGGDDSGTCSTLGGLGGYAKGTLNVAPQATLFIFVGGDGMSGGYNGGAGNAGPYSGSIGGGASDVRFQSADLSNRSIVAGGGGASAAHSLGCGGWNGAAGGHGGGATGATGEVSNGNPPASGGGQGGNQSAGGAGGSNVNPFLSSTNGELAQGGKGGHGNADGISACGAGGGGGGGYYGGGGGGSHNCGGGGGGGGSNYTGGVLDAINQQGIQNSHGRVVITY